MLFELLRNRSEENEWCIMPRRPFLPSFPSIFFLFFLTRQALASKPRHSYALLDQKSVITRRLHGCLKNGS